MAATTLAAQSLWGQDNATGTIRVTPNLGTQTKDGYTVCTGTTANRALYGTKVTSSTGIVTFTGIPSGNEVVTTVTKPGFTGREAKWLVPPPGSNRDVTIYMFSGTGGPACSSSGSTTTTVTTAPPSPSSVRIQIAPPAGVSPQGWWVCVGTQQNRGQYGYVMSPSTGIVTFTNLPGSGMLTATAMKTGFATGVRDWYPTPGQAAAFSMPVVSGMGAGITCPGYVAQPATTTTQPNTVRVDGTAITALPSDPTTTVRVDGTPIYAAPAGTAYTRLPEETLVSRGEFGGTTTQSKTDCTASSYRNVMIGVEGAMMDTVIKTMKVSCTTVRDAITNEKFIPRGINRGYMDYYVRCSPGRVLVGFSGTLAYNQIRSFKLTCQKMGNNGLVTGETTTTEDFGKVKSIPFGPDKCTAGRSGKALRVSTGKLSDGLPAGDVPPPSAIVGFQLTCEQPRID